MARRTLCLNLEISAWVVGFCHRILLRVWSISLNQQCESTGQNQQRPHPYGKRSVARRRITPDRRAEKC